MTKNNKLLGAILLIVGTCIGASVLALPISTAEYGFIPSVILFVIVWFLMTIAALLMLEANLWFKSEANIISMAKETLGKAGEFIAWITYLLLLYALMAAYISGMNALITNAVETVFNLHLQSWIGSLLLIFVFGLIIYLGPKPIDYLNRLLMIGLALSYFMLVSFIGPKIDIAKLIPINFSHWWIPLPILVTTFGYHIVIPSVRTYLESDAKKIRLAIIIGSLISLLIYLIWEMIILGVVPKTGDNSLMRILASGQPATELTKALENILHNNTIATASSFFAFYAIATSFIGVSFSLFDFLADGFEIKKTHLGRLSTAILTFAPPLFFALYYPRGFIVALGFAGIFVAVLLMILPALMVYSGRYFQNRPKKHRVIGGKTMLMVVITFSLLVIIVELYTSFRH